MNCKKNRKIPLWWGIIIWAVLVLLFFAPAVFGGKVLAPVDCVECLFKPFATQPMEEVHNQYNVDGASQYLPYSSPGKVMGIWDGTLILTMGLHCRKIPC
jgi:hypothetical protein